MLARNVLAFCVTGLALFVGCTSHGDDTNSGDPASTGGQDLSSSSTAKEGDSCGGTVAHPKQCASGLTCVMPDQPHAIGGTGTCQKDELAKEGESCEGAVAHPKQCASGLTCVLPDGPNAVGGTGTCQALAKEGESCGGTVAKPKQCEPQLTCVMPDQPHAIGGTGTCQHRDL
jgi:hypothetical protein